MPEELVAPTEPLHRSQRLDDVLVGRRSVRHFLREPIPAGVVEQAIEAAGWAPSPHGVQPWRFVVVEREDVRRELAEAMAATWRDQLLLDGEPESVVAIRLERGRARIIDAPCLVIVCLFLDDLHAYPDDDRRAAEVTMAIQSLGAAVQNFLLSVYAQGFDAGWMCAPLFCPDIVRATLGLRSDLHPHAMIPVGIAARDPVRRPRRPLDVLIDRWI